MPKLDTKKALVLVEKTIEEAESLRAGSYENGKDYLDAIDAKIKRIIKMAFDDAEEKLKEYSYNPIIVSMGSKTKADLEKSYQRDVSRYLRQLYAMKKELELIQSVETDEVKLDKTEADIEKARKEAVRRGYVVESKVAGAAIEIIDRLRDELKRRTGNSKEIGALKKEIAELREVLQLMAEDLRIDTEYLQAKKREEQQDAEKYYEP